MRYNAEYTLLSAYETQPRATKKKKKKEEKKR